MTIMEAIHEAPDSRRQERPRETTPTLPSYHPVVYDGNVATLRVVRYRCGYCG